MASWIAVDLDGTLAEYRGWQGEDHIGDPVPAMLERVVHIIHAWLAKHGLPPLAITNVKDYGMIQLWDDRAVRVIPNTGRPIEELLRTNAAVECAMTATSFAAK